ncbi:MmgE/PrpD family protein, partial [Parasphingopyxis sp.]|uniref:MmgE/PrpD family protein n=1 Tax=Parasphingopyxis sp. TaxID=1920299 RepID=UPI0026184A84
MTATQRLLDFAATDHRLPDITRDAAVRLLADTLAGGAAGAVSEEERQVREAVRRWGGASGEDARLIGLDECLPAPSAAWCNG